MITKIPTKSLLVLVAVLTEVFLAVSVCFGAGQGQPISESLDSLMSRYHELGEFNGSVLVVREGRILVNKGYGWADMKEKTANGPETKYFIGSITKQFTAVMILKLVEMGRLSIDTTLAEALPYYRKDTGSKVKIRHLLEHTSGIPSFTDFPEEGVLTDPEPEEIQLNAFGYELQGQKRLPDALAVFSFTVEQLPNSWNAYDSLAEAQAALGKNEEAIKNYEKSLELNPANKNASEQIQKLKKNNSPDQAKELS